MKILKTFGGKMPDNSAEFSHSRIPKVGSPQRSEIVVRSLNTQGTPKQILDIVYKDKQWPISGGWGYTKQDACVIDLGTEAEGISFEYEFIRHRAYVELILTRPAHSRYSGINVKLEYQATMNDGGRQYDEVKYTITAFRDADWEFLKKDWESHDSYKDDPEGLRRHLEMKERLQVHYSTSGWFDITSFYGKL